jgi:hypothetical protein
LFWVEPCKALNACFLATIFTCDLILSVQDWRALSACLRRGILFRKFSRFARCERVSTPGEGSQPSCKFPVNSVLEEQYGAAYSGGNVNGDHFEIGRVSKNADTVFTDS